MDRGKAAVSLRSLSDESKLAPALDTLQKVITSPDFIESDLERHKNRVLVGIQRKQQSPGTLASEAFEAAIYQQHPYAFPNEGTAESLATINSSDLVNFHNEYYTASNAMITLVGDIDRAQAETIAEAVTQGLPQGIRPMYRCPGLAR
jgi:zinc protease